MLEPDENFDRDAKSDGLGVGLFALLSVMLDEMAVVLPGGSEALKRIRSGSLDLIARVAPAIEGIYGAAVRENAEGVIASVFAGTIVERGGPSTPDDGG